MTDIRIERRKLTYTTGVVRFADNGSPVSSGVVLIEVSDGAALLHGPDRGRPRTADSGATTATRSARTRSGSQAHFLGSYSAAASESEQVEPER